MCGQPGLLVGFPLATMTLVIVVSNQVFCVVLFAFSLKITTTKNPQNFDFWTFQIYVRLLILDFCLLGVGWGEDDTRDPEPRNVEWEKSLVGGDCGVKLGQCLTWG